MGTGDADQTAERPHGVHNPSSECAPTTAELRFAHAPPLAWLATFAAVAHVAIQRVALPLWASQGAPPSWLSGALQLALNLTGIASLVTFAWALHETARTADYSHAGRRLLILTLGSFLTVMTLSALVMPPGRIDAHLVLLATAATHTLVVQMAMAAMRQHVSLSGRTTAALTAVAALFPLGSLLLRQLIPLGPSIITRDGVGALHALGELCYLLVPIAAAFVFVPWEESQWSGRARAAGALATFGMGLLFAGAAQLPAQQYGHLLYSTLRLEFALERASLGYAVPISLAVGAATAALLSRDFRHRQGGLALWLWLAAGYNPLSPLRLLLWALAATLLGRALIGLASDGVSPATEKN